MKRRGDLAVLAALLPLLAAASYFIFSQTRINVEIRPHRTTFSPLPGGYKAAYLLLEQRGLPVARLKAGPNDWPKDARVIVTSSPYSLLIQSNAWDQATAKKARTWVENGGTLLLLTDTEDELTRLFSLNLKDSAKPNITLVPRQPAAFLQDVNGVAFPQESRFTRTPPEAITLFGDKQPAFIALPRGKGTIFATTSPGIFENHTLKDADNARLLAQLVESAGGNRPGKIYFDEFHQGFAEERSFTDVIGSPGRLALLQLTLFTVILCYTRGRRFGLPRPAPPPSRVSSEYVASLADLYRRAGARDAALEGVYLSFWRDLCRAAGVAIDADNEDVARRASGLTEGTDTEREIFRLRLAALIEQCETRIAAGPKGVSDTDLLRLTREMETVRKELRLGAND